MGDVVHCLAEIGCIVKGGVVCYLCGCTGAVVVVAGKPSQFNLPLAVPPPLVDITYGGELCRTLELSGSRE